MLSVSIVVGFLIFLRAPDEVQLSLDAGGDPNGSSAPSSTAASSTAASTSDASSSDASSSATAPSTAAATDPAPASAADPTENAGPVGADEPVEAAALWLTNFRSVSWEDPEPTAWLGRLAPYITPELAAEYDASADTASTAGGWSAFVSGKCTSTVEGADGAISPDAPIDQANTQVNISGTIRTTCDDGTSAHPDEVVSAVVAVTLTESGRWLVSEQVS